jgi:DNA-binding transcriptional ArsR family regulator
LRPLDWVTLEDLALDAVREEGQLVSRTSARQVADHLRVEPLAVARALKVLRNRGLVSLEPDRVGIGRRFELWVYVLGPVSGLTVIDGTLPSSPSLRHPEQERFWRRRGTS